VIGGAVGKVRCAIVLHGDVVDATRRLEQVAREVGCSFIASVEHLTFCRLMSVSPCGSVEQVGCWRPRSGTAWGPLSACYGTTPGFVASET